MDSSVAELSVFYFSVYQTTGVWLCASYLCRGRVILLMFCIPLILHFEIIKAPFIEKENRYVLGMCMYFGEAGRKIDLYVVGDEDA
jgi:hypothetical protein